MPKAYSAKGPPMPPDDTSLKGKLPESWVCVDCGVNTAPGLFNRAEMEAAFAAQGDRDDGVEQHITSGSEVYTVRDAVWKAAGMEPMGGCLCIGCLEKRLGRVLRPKDFLRGDPFNAVPTGSARLLKRQKR
jgi:hypothetical protein